MSPTKELVLSKPIDVTAQIVRAEDFQPLLNVEAVLARKKALDEITAQVLKPDVDYGVQPGSASKQLVLKKAGAEKLMSTFGLAPKIINEVKIQDWTGQDHGGEPFFYHEYTIGLYRGDRFFGEAVGSCNSWEKKYRYQWVPEEEAKHRPDFDSLPKKGGRRKIFEPLFALDKRETGGRFGKPIEYWDRFDAMIHDGKATKAQREMGKEKKVHSGYEIEVDDVVVRIPNPNSADLVNTVQKLGFKRSLVAAVLIVTNCSDGFTQDLEEDEHGESVGAGAGSGPVMSAAEEMEEEKKKSEPAKRETKKKDPPPAEKEQGPGAGAQTSFDSPPPRPSTMEKPAPTSAAQQSQSRQIPEEMRRIIERVRENPGKELPTAYNLMWQQACRRGEAYARAHEELNGKYRDRFPKGARVTIDDVVNHLLDQWDLLQQFPPEPS